MASPTNNVAFVLVPGSFSETLFYDQVVNRLTSQGYMAKPVPLVSAGDRSPKPPGTMFDDAEAIRNAAIELLDSGKDVVIAMNSYGGIPGSEAVNGLSRAEREPDAKTAVIGLVYIASFVLPVGTSIADKSEQDGIPLFPGDEPYMSLDAAVLPPIIFSDLPEAEQKKWFDTMPVHARVSFDGRLTYPGYKYVPSTFLITEKDMVVAPGRQHQMVDSANAELAQDMKIKKVLLDSGHVPMLSRPDEVTQVLVDAAARR